MTNGNEPINAVLDQSASLQNETSLGLTKREHMAIEFTKAIISTATALKQGTTNDIICKHAISIADELIKQLNSEAQ